MTAPTQVEELLSKAFGKEFRLSCEGPRGGSGRGVSVQDIRDTAFKIVDGTIPQDIYVFLASLPRGPRPLTDSEVLQDFFQPRDEAEAAHARALAAAWFVWEYGRDVARRQNAIDHHMPELLPSVEGREMLRGIIRIAEKQRMDFEALLVRLEAAETR